MANSHKNVAAADAHAPATHTASHQAGGSDALTGAVAVTTIELGHATDTTIARASAGNLTVEGNALYRAGGTDVAVADGGTGASTAAGGATALGVGTGDSPQFTAINLGHASDTTITRVSAGVIAVEGVTIGGSGSVATDAIWDAAGDLAQGTGANTAAKLSAGTLGQFLMSGGAAAANLWASRELDYVEITSPVSITATTEATADVIVTGNAVAYDGATAVMIEFFAGYYTTIASNANLSFYLYDGASSIGRFGLITNAGVALAMRTSIHLMRRLTPSNATHTYSIRGVTPSGTSVSGAGAGGTAADVPSFIRITRAV